MLDDFLEALNPIYQEAAEKKKPAAQHLVDNQSRVADALLAVTDRRAQQAQRQVVRGAYDKLRPMAKKQVEQAAPRMGKLLEKHAEYGLGPYSLWDFVFGPSPGLSCPASFASDTDTATGLAGLVSESWSRARIVIWSSKTSEVVAGRRRRRGELTTRAHAGGPLFAETLG